MWPEGQVRIGQEERSSGAWGTTHAQMWPTARWMLQRLHQIPAGHLWKTLSIFLSWQRCPFVLARQTYTRAHTPTPNQCYLPPGLGRDWLLIKCLRFRMKEYIRTGTFFFFPQTWKNFVPIDMYRLAFTHKHPPQHNFLQLRDELQ